MGIFNRRDKVVDLSEDYHYERKKLRDSLKITSPSNPPVQSQESSVGGFFNFFGGSSPSASSEAQSPQKSDTTVNANTSLAPDEKRRRLAKRLKDMTDRIEELSNQIYLLQQRIEVLESKANINKYE